MSRFLLPLLAGKGCGSEQEGRTGISDNTLVFCIYRQFGFQNCGGGKHMLQADGGP